MRIASDAFFRHIGLGVMIFKRGASLFLLLFLALGVSFSATGHADAAAPAPKGNNTRIVSEKMTYDSAKNQVLFEGKVHVTRVNMQIWSESLTLVLDNSGKKASSNGGTNALGMEGGKVERIIAEKSVRIQQDNKTGTCGRAVYHVNQGRIVMDQSPVLVDGDNRIKGRTIIYYTQSGKSEVIGDVDVQFSTDDSKSPALPSVTPGTTNGTAAPSAGANGEKAAQ